MENNYLESIRKQFEYYKQLGDKTMDRLTDDQLYWQFNAESNSIVTIVKHMHGNMMSRWTDFLTTDGEKEWRQRDAEFEQEHLSKAKLLEIWEEGWKCLFTALEALKPEDLSKTVYIRNQGQTAIDAINRQLAHYPYHIGQMVFVGKMIQNENWESLSIPRNASQAYNSEKFSKEKHNEHFTDEYLKKNKSDDE